MKAQFENEDTFWIFPTGFCDDGFPYQKPFSNQLINKYKQRLVILEQEWYWKVQDLHALRFFKQYLCRVWKHHSFTDISLMPFLCTLPASSLIIDSLTIQHQNKKTSCSNCKQYLYHNYSFTYMYSLPYTEMNYRALWQQVCLINHWCFGSRICNHHKRKTSHKWFGNLGIGF